MSTKIKKRHPIDWLNIPGYKPETKNPFSGCSPISAGCKNCYAERMAFRQGHMGNYPMPPNHFDITHHVHIIRQMASWRIPRVCFLGSMTDVFHDEIIEKYRASLISMFALIDQRAEHIFIVLTKRPENARLFFNEWWDANNGEQLPLNNLWLGVSVCDTADLKNIQHLKGLPGAKKIISFEPLLADVGKLDLSGIDWVIVGGESGPGARPMHPLWVFDIEQQCREQGVPFFFKQWGEWSVLGNADKIKKGDVLITHPKTNIMMRRVGKKKAGLNCGSRWSSARCKEFPK